VIAGLHALERPAAGEAAGALVLLHGRGADEHDLHPVLDLLDPERRLLGVTPRGPLTLPPGGAHWYRLGGIPTPDPETFWPTFAQLGAFVDGLPVPLDRIVLGGFSQGAVMTYAVALAEGRPRPAGIVCLSGFVPRVPGLALDLDGLAGYPVAIAHGSYDPVIPESFGAEAKRLLESAGADVLWRETPVTHTIDPAIVPDLLAFVRRLTS
jgi:phospholipase/carboxylesterase